MALTAADATLLRVAIGANPAGEWPIGLPVLAGEPVENLFPAARPAGRAGDFALFELEGWRLGAATVDLSRGLETAAQDLYRELFAAARGHQLARIWNYVPAINERGPAGLENYRLFCRGRSIAFEQEYGVNFKTAMPAASAVGGRNPVLTVLFAATAGHPRHVENPRQVPAYDYPAEYGPRSPSFSRATIVPGPGPAAVFISGTAAIRGHATIAPDRIDQQLECTLENLREISRACGLGSALGAGEMARRHFKVYLRHAADQPAVAVALEQHLFQPADLVTYLQADICRAPLCVEIEANLFRRSATTRP